MDSLAFLQIDDGWGNYSNYCIDDYNITKNYIQFHDVIRDKIFKYRGKWNVNWGYEYNSTSKKCVLKPILKETGLSAHSYNFLIGFSGSLVGFVILFSLILLSLNVVRRD